MKNKQHIKVFSKENVTAVQSAIIRRFGTFAGVDIRESDGQIRIIEKTPKARQIHVAVEFSERDVNGEKLTGLSFSSEAPVMRYGEPEILLHDAESADFTRLLNVGAILKNHDPAVILGVPVRAWIDDKRRGNLAMRWGTTADAMKGKQEALVDKSLRGVSVGYSVREWIYLKAANEIYRGIPGPAWIASKWDALEASLTPIPADPSVGLERSIRVCDRARESKQNSPASPGDYAGPKREELKMKKIKLLRAWKASDGKTYDAGVELEVDERTFAELAEGDKPQAEAVTETRAVKVIETPAPEGKEVKVDFKAEARAAFREEMRLEVKRASDIRGVCKRFDLADMADELIAGGKTVEEAQRSVLDKIAERSASQTPTQGSIHRGPDATDKFRSRAIDGLVLREGSIKVDKPADGANEIRGMTLRELAKECLRQAGIKAPSNTLEMVGLALGMRGAETISGSTSDFPLILAATANKFLLAGYEVAGPTYPLWTRFGSLNDFKAATRLKFAEVGQLKLVAEGGKYTETKRTEKKETIQLGTYARMWTMSRQGVINDDLGAFTSTQFSFGMQARMLPNDLAIAVLTANAAMTDGFSLFSTQHGNYSHETDRRLDTLAHAVAALKYSKNLMAMQKSYQHPDESGGARYLGLRPKVWLVNDNDEYFARQVVVSATDASQSNAGVDNPFRSIGLTVVVEQNIQTSATDYSHYLFADPRLAPVIEVAFLQGNQQPYSERIDQTDADGSKWLCRLDCGAAAVDSVGAVLESGTD